MQAHFFSNEVKRMSGDKSLRTEGLRWLPYVLAVIFLYILYVSFDAIRIVGSSDDLKYLHSFDTGYNIRGNFTWNRWLPIGIFSFFEALGVPPRSVSNLCFFFYVPALLLANYLLSKEIFGDRKHLVLCLSVIFTCNITWISLVSFLRLPLHLLLVFLALSAYSGLQDRKSNNFVLIFLSTLVISLSYQSAIYVMVCFVLLTLTAQYVRNDDTDLKVYLLKLIMAAATISSALVTFFIITKIAGAFVSAGDGRYEITSLDELIRNFGIATKRMWIFLVGDYLYSTSRIPEFNLKTLSLILLVLSTVIGLVFSRLRLKLAIAVSMLMLAIFAIGIQPLQLATGHMSLAPRVYGFFQYLIFGALALSLMVVLGHFKTPAFAAGKKLIVPGVYLALAVCTAGFAGQLVQAAEDSIKTRERENAIAQTVQSFYVINQIDFEKPTYVSFSSPAAWRSITHYFTQASHLFRNEDKGRELIAANTSLGFLESRSFDQGLQDLGDRTCRRIGRSPRELSEGTGGSPRVFLREMDDFVMLCLDGPS